MKKAKKEKLAVSAKAARILRKVAAHILEEPRRFEMSRIQNRWTIHDDVLHFDDLEYTRPPCGTTACIAGWCDLLYSQRPRAEHAWNRAIKMLGITSYRGQHFDEGQDSMLFYADKWPEKYSRGYYEAKTPRQRARLAARRIEHFIKTGE